MGAILVLAAIAYAGYRFRKQKQLRGRTGFQSWVSKGAGKADPQYMNEVYSSVGSERAHVIDGGSFANTINGVNHASGSVNSDV